MKRILEPEEKSGVRLTTLLLVEEYAAVELLRKMEARTASSFIRSLIQEATREAMRAKKLSDVDIIKEIKHGATAQKFKALSEAVKRKQAAAAMAEASEVTQ